MSRDGVNASEHAGIMTHYIADVAVFRHVRGAKTDWGAETPHSDYEGYVQRRTDNYTSATFDPYIMFDGAGRGIVNETCELCGKRSLICEGTHYDGKAFCNMACKDAYAIAHGHDHSR